MIKERIKQTKEAIKKPIEVIRIIEDVKFQLSRELIINRISK